MAAIERIAFLGLGIMGRPMAANLVRAGFEVTVWWADGSEAHGATKLSTIRDSYLED